jgi:hypothetical protein
VVASPGEGKYGDTVGNELELGVSELGAGV